MFCPLEKIKASDLALKFGLLAVGLGILFVSMSRVGWDILAKDNGGEKAKQKVVYLDTISSKFYRLPIPGMLPTHPLYGLKELRNKAWVMMAKGEQKFSLVLLLADKKWSEAMELWEIGSGKAAIGAGGKAIDNLEYANSLISLSRASEEVKLQERERVLTAGTAYELMLEGKSKEEGITKLLTRIHEWNQKQEKEKLASKN